MTISALTIAPNTPQILVKAILIVPLLAFAVYLVFGTVSETSILIVKFPFIKLTFELVQIAQFHSLGCTPLTQSAFK